MCDVVCEAGEPCPRHLAEAVEVAVEEANGVWLVGIDEADGLLAVDLLVELSMKERVGNIQLVGRPLLAGEKGEDGADRGRLNHGRECLTEVDSGSLPITA